MESKAVRLIGLARRARCVFPGENAVKAVIKRKECHLIVVASDASNNTAEKFKNIADTLGIPLVSLSTKQELGDLLGTREVAVLGIKGRHFVKGILGG